MVASSTNPRLIHPITITIEQIDKGATIYDHDTREPIQQASRSSTVTIKAQIRFRSLDEVDLRRGGDRLDARGYVLFRRKDMEKQSITINPNDKITSIGHQTGLEYFITRIEWIGHYPLHNGPSLLKAWFDDRAPGKQSGV